MPQGFAAIYEQKNDGLHFEKCSIEHKIYCTWDVSQVTRRVSSIVQKVTTEELPEKRRRRKMSRKVDINGHR